VEDRVAAWMGRFGDNTIRLELEFVQQLDDERLAKTIDLALDAEPVLGCRYVTQLTKAYWERVERNPMRLLQVTADEREYEAFKTDPINAYLGPQINACLWHAPDGDHLLFKVSHQVADAGGVKEIAEIISSIYCQLANAPDYRPEPNVTGSRSLLQLVRHIPWQAYPHICLDSVQWLWANALPHTTHTLPLSDRAGGSPVFVSRLIPAERVAEVVGYGRLHNATLNDMVLTAFLRALAAEGNWEGRSRLSVITTVDLRRYLPSGRGGAVANLSAALAGWPSLTTELGKDFHITLARVAAITRRGKAGWIGLELCLGILPIVCAIPNGCAMRLHRTIVEQHIKSRSYPHTLANAGRISPESVTFGAQPLKAWFLPPLVYPAYPPMFLLGLSGYQGTLFLSAGVFPSQRGVVEHFLDSMLSELSGLTLLV